MAEFKHSHVTPIDITWDDVRPAFWSHLLSVHRRRIKFYCVVTLCAVLILTYGLKRFSRGKQENSSLSVPTPQPVAQVKKSKKKTNLCDQIQTWTSSTRLQMGDTLYDACN